MKKVFKIIIDVLMIIFMLLEYSKIYTGQLLHEIIGIVLLVLFVIHNFLNINFYKNIFKGKYNFLRTFTTIINLSFLICMLFTIILGIPISNEVFNGLNLKSNITTRKLHTILGYWSLVILSIHLGLHYKVIFAKLNNRISKNQILKLVLYIIELLIVILGIKFMIDVNLVKHLTGQLLFGTFDGNMFLSILKNFVIVLSIGIIIYNFEKLIIKKRKEN